VSQELPGEFLDPDLFGEHPGVGLYQRRPMALMEVLLPLHDLDIASLIDVFGDLIVSIDPEMLEVDAVVGQIEVRSVRSLPGRGGWMLLLPLVFPSDAVQRQPVGHGHLLATSQPSVCQVS